MKELMQVEVYNENNRPRLCPKCGKKLMIKIKTHIVSCERCSYTEPCHLRNLEPNEKNCSKCPYSPYFKEESIKSIPERTIKSLEKINSMRFILGLAGKLKLRKKKQSPLKFPKLKGKCYQAWNPKIRTKSYNPESEAFE